MKKAAMHGSQAMESSTTIVAANSHDVLALDSADLGQCVTANEADQSQDKSPNSSVLGASNSLETEKDLLALSSQQVRKVSDVPKWRLQVERLSQLGAPLLAVGTDKAPIHLVTGRHLSGWQQEAFKAEQIAESEAAIGCGVRTGNGLLVFDVDGVTALEWLLDHGCAPRAAKTWQIHRDTDANRFKVAFTLTAEQQQQFGNAKPKEHTKDAVKDDAGNVIKKGEAVEVFHSTGGQVVVLGRHHDSGGNYYWPDGLAVEELAPIPPAWWEAACTIAGSTTTAKVSTTKATSSSREWKPLNPCPICGRNTTSYCSEHQDGNSIRCHHGNTFNPENTYGELKPGREITDNQGTIWAVAKTEPQSNGDLFTLFITPKTKSRLSGRIAYKQQGADPTREEVERRTYKELLVDALAAIRRRDEDTEMEIRAEIMGRFKRSDAQLTAAFFRLLTQQETGRSAGDLNQTEALDLNNIEGMDALVDGAMPANDLGLTYGGRGSGKTAAALALSFAVIDGTGFLDHTKPTEKGSVLFIASDSGAAPLKAEMQRMGLADHPAVKMGPNQRFYVWAHDAKQSMPAWSASINGCVDLLQFIKAKSIRLVVMDSAKTICAKAGISYLDNDSITALLTFLKETICVHASVMILSHDGTEKGSHSGAKAWAEVPSIVHNIQQIPDAPQERLWRVVKNRMGPLRELRYQIGDDGRLEPVAGVEMIQDAGAAVLQVLRDAHANGVTSVGSKDLVAEIGQRFRLAPKTVANTLTRMTGASKPEICRVASKRGHYKLAPRMQALIGVRVFGKEDDQTPVVERDLPSSRHLPEGRTREQLPDLPDNPASPRAGKTQKASEGDALSLFDSREREIPIGELLEVGAAVKHLGPDGWCNGWKVADVVEVSTGTRYRIERGGETLNVDPDQIQLCGEKAA